MKIVVFSDSHRDIINMANVIEHEMPQAVFHLGDHISDAFELEYIFPQICFYCVKGNCDFGAAEEERIFALGGHIFLLAHGHRYGVKAGFSRVVAHAKSQRADVLLFGHTHKPVIERHNDLIVMNPGHAGRRTNGAAGATYGVIEQKGGALICRIVPCD